jgi:hypothetical protein
MSPYPGDDRRRAPRVARQLPLILTDHVGELSAVTRNISVSGAYCMLRRHIPPMTKLNIHFALPGSGTMSCEGVVVRVEPAQPVSSVASYHIAIFFNDISEDNRTRLSQYVHRHLRAVPNKGGAKPRTTRHQ